MTEAEWLACLDPAAMLRLRRTDCCGCLWVDNGDGTVSLCGGQKPCGQCDNGPILPYTPFSDRKLRLFACACCRVIWDQIQDGRSRQAVEVAERFADGIAGEVALMYARAEAMEASAVNGINASVCLKLTQIEDLPDVAWAVSVLAKNVTVFKNDGTGETYRPCSSLVQSAILRRIVGNPFRPVTFDPAYRTEQVLNLALAAYEERLPDGRLDPDRLAVLSDALEDAGCADEAILRHLRGEELAPMAHMPHLGWWRPLRGPHWRGCWAVDLLLGKE